MTDYIIEEVREARAALAAEFDHDIGRIIAWAQAQEAAERESRKQTSLNKSMPRNVGPEVLSEFGVSGSTAGGTV